jgi:hypothetical protein
MLHEIHRLAGAEIAKINAAKYADPMAWADARPHA